MSEVRHERREGEAHPFALASVSERREIERQGITGQDGLGTAGERASRPSSKNTEGSACLSGLRVHAAGAENPAPVPLCLWWMRWKDAVRQGRRSGVQRMPEAADQMVSTLRLAKPVSPGRPSFGSTKILVPSCAGRAGAAEVMRAQLRRRGDVWPTSSHPGTYFDLGSATAAYGLRLFDARMAFSGRARARGRGARRLSDHGVTRCHVY